MEAVLSSERHERALRSIGYALVLQDEPRSWLGLEVVLRARLTPCERAYLLTSVALANEPELLFEVLEAIVPARSVGTPLPVLFDINGDARWWAEQALLPELKAWATACFVRLPVRDQAGFLAAAKRRAAA